MVLNESEKNCAIWKYSQKCSLLAFKLTNMNMHVTRIRSHHHQSIDLCEHAPMCLSACGLRFVLIFSHIYFVPWFAFHIANYYALCVCAPLFPLAFLSILFLYPKINARHLFTFPVNTAWNAKERWDFMSVCTMNACFISPSSFGHANKKQNREFITEKRGKAAFFYSNLVHFYIVQINAENLIASHCFPSIMSKALIQQHFFFSSSFCTAKWECFYPDIDIPRFFPHCFERLAVRLTNGRVYMRQFH